MISKIAVIGTGSFGGFLARELAEQDPVSNLVLVDFDAVEEKNLENSIYKRRDIGKPKVEVLARIIEALDVDVEVIALREKFLEGKTVIPKCDLVIDCRDFTYDRRGEIDIRLYISGRHLIIDCRKKVNYRVPQQGRYLLPVTKNDLKQASNFATSFIFNSSIFQQVEREVVLTLNLDYVKTKTDDFHWLVEQKEDFVYDSHPNLSKVIDLDQNVKPIIEMNKKDDVTFCVNEPSQPLVKKTIPKNVLKVPGDVSSCLASLLNFLTPYESFSVVRVIERGVQYVVIVPSIGST